uniref:Uncharacterized protein n=1 Tax=viral metagenome TaxID=1070528 RepID=A0A6C0CT64_9ZZZZ
MDLQLKSCGAEILSDIIINTKYARALDNGEKESWIHIVQRNLAMHKETFPQLCAEIETAYEWVYDKKIMPSMRSLQFGGSAIQINPIRMYNCAYLPINDLRSFSEVMFLLMSGTGVGFSVQDSHINQLPIIKKPKNERRKRYLVADTCEGWADAIRILMKSYFTNTTTILFDYRAIRPKGTPLKTSGGKAPGHKGLEQTIMKIAHLLDNKNDGDRLTSLECHDIVCYIASAVLSGGIRRSALISLFSENDHEMFLCKTGNFYENNPQRCFANNSVVLLRNTITESKFKSIWKRVFAIGTGEPGVYLTNDLELGTNPCCEISLQPYQFCNLVEIDVSYIKNEDDYYDRCKHAAFIATLQATYTDFHYLRSQWGKTTEKEALIGVSMTGLSSCLITTDMMSKGAKIVCAENERVAKILGIRKAYRCTTIKPSGTTSIVFGSSSGISAWHSQYYLRRIRITKTDPLCVSLNKVVPELIEDDVIRPHDTCVLTLPICAANIGRSIVRQNETSLAFLERVKEVFQYWILSGHVKGTNTNNISSTVNVRNHEKEEVVQWLYDNREYYNGITVFNYDENECQYEQLPFETIDYDTFVQKNEFLVSRHAQINRLFNSSNTCLKDDTISPHNANDYCLDLELACSGSSCEIKRV